MAKTIKKNSKIDFYEDLYTNLRKPMSKPTIEHEQLRNKKKFKQKMKYIDVE